MIFMPESIQKMNKLMNHYFMVDDNHGNMYRIGARGDREVIQKLLQRYSRNVRYLETKPDERGKKGRNYMGIQLVSCRYQYQLGVKWLVR